MMRAGAIPRTRAWGIALAFVTACVSGVAVFVNGYGVTRFDDATAYTTAKNLVAASLLLGLLAAGSAASRAPEGSRAAPRSRREWAGLALVGVIGGSVPFVLFFEGLARASSADAAFIHKTLVVWVAVLAVPLLRERLGPLHVGAIALLVLGQGVLADDLGGVGVGAGEAMILAATLLWAAEFVLAKRLLGSIGSLTLGAARMGFGVVILVAWLVVTGRLGDLVGLSASQWGWALVTGGILAAFVAAWYVALARAQAVDAAAVLVFGAVITAALAGGFRGAPVGPDWPGLLLIVLGAVLAGSAALRERPAPERAEP